jgi:hypothetical protein
LKVVSPLVAKARPVDVDDLDYTSPDQDPDKSTDDEELEPVRKPAARKTGKTGNNEDTTHWPRTPQTRDKAIILQRSAAAKATDNTATLRNPEDPGPLPEQ